MPNHNARLQQLERRLDSAQDAALKALSTPDLETFYALLCALEDNPRHVYTAEEKRVERLFNQLQQEHVHAKP